MDQQSMPWWQTYMEMGDAAGVAPGFVRELGITPDGWEPGKVFLKWKPPAFTRVPLGWVQGGFLAVPLDMAMSFAVVTQSPENTGAVTIDMKLTYIRTPFDEEYRVTGSVVRLGRLIAHTEGRIENLSGELIATASSASMIKTFIRE